MPAVEQRKPAFSITNRAEIRFLFSFQALALSHCLSRVLQALDFIKLADLPKKDRNEYLERLLMEGCFDFLDFGTHKGGGLTKGIALGGKAGLGVELSEPKVIAALKRGLPVYSSDILNFEPKGDNIRFAICRHVLEHMPDLYVVGRIIRKLSGICSEYIFIEQPNFDDDSELASQGFAISSTLLDYHTCRMTTYQFKSIFCELGLRSYVVAGRDPMLTSADPKLFDVRNARNRTSWELGMDLPKEETSSRPGSTRTTSSSWR